MSSRFQDQNKTIQDFYNEVWVVCPSCDKKAVAKVIEENNQVSLYCKHCGYNKKKSTEIYISGTKDILEMPAHRFFDTELWLQASFKNEMFYAYNDEHLTYLENYISANLREHKGRSHFTLLEKLPKFYHEAKNREALLKLIQKLKTKLNNMKNLNLLFVLLGIQLLNAQNNAKAELKLADAAFAKKNYGVMVDHLTKAAELNNSEALYSLFSLYFEGQYVEKNETKAIELLKKSADLGFVPAMNNYSYYLVGQNNEQSNAEALAYLQKSVVAKDPEAIRLMAFYYQEGLADLPKSNDKALELYKKSAAMGFEGANKSGVHLVEKMYPEKDKKRTEELEYFSSLGDAHAMYHLANNYWSFIFGGDEGKAKEYYLKSAEKGYVKSMYAIGRLEIYSNKEVAKKWLQKALDQGYGDAGYLLAQLYTGSERFDYLEKAAALGSEKAMDMVHYSYNNGDDYYGVKKDVEKAKQLESKYIEILKNKNEHAFD